MASNAVQRARRPDIQRLDTFLLRACLLVLGAAVLYPTVRLLVQAGASWDMDALRTGNGYAALRNTLVLCLASVAGAGLAGVSLAFALTRYSFPGARILSVFVYLPFTLPPLSGVLSFYFIIGRDGFIPRFFEHYLGIPGLEIPGFWAILLIHTYSFYVFFYAMSAPALAAMDRAQIEAARTLGAGKVRVFLQVTVPLLLPALLGASLLTFMSSAASFSAPYFFGGDFPVLSKQIYDERSQFNTEAALTLTIVLAAVSLVGLLLFRGRKRASGAASKGVPAPIRGRGGRIAAAIGAWSCIVLLLTPHAVIVWLSFVDHREWYAEIIPRTLTLGNFRQLAARADAFQPILNSIWMSALAMGTTTFVALPAAYLIARRRPGHRWLNIIVMLPWALPGTVIAMNLITAFNDRWLPLYGTVWLLPVAYFVRNVPLLTRMAGAAIETFDASLLEAGQSLGATRAYCFRLIVLPLLTPFIAAGMALVFVTSLGEFVASILLYTAGNIPISVKINMEWHESAGAAFAYSVLLMLLVAVTFAFTRRFTSRSL